MSRDKTDTILKGVVKHFFVEKEVTSTLVMDSLYSGLKSLESQGKNKKGGMKLVEMVEFPASIIHIEKDMFVLADDVLLLLERVALGPMPLQPSTPKDEKGSQNRTKDASSGDEFNKDTIERDERRLTDFGRGVLEFFVVAHIFGKIEVAYQEAVALKRQEELIREEEAAEQAENELKAKRSVAEKEKRTRKKQAKQRRNNRKVKDRARDEIKSDFMVQKNQQHESQPNEVLLGPFTKQEVLVVDKYRASENAADTSDTGDDISEMAVQPDLEDRDCSSINWDTDTSEIHPAEVGNEQILNGQTEKRTASSVMDDSSSTCSTDSIPSVVMNNVPFKGNSSTNRIHVPHYRGKSQQGKDLPTRPSDVGHLSGAGIIRTLKSEPEIVLATNARNQGLEHPVEEKKKLNVKDQVNSLKPSNLRTLDAAASSSSTTTSSSSSSSSSPGRSDRILHSSSSHQANQPQEGFTSTITTKSESSSGMTQTDPVKESPTCSSNPSSSLVHSATRSPQISTFKIESEKLLTPAKSSSSSLARQEATSRPSSAPLISAPPRRPTPPLASTTTIQSTSPLLSRSLSAAGKLDAPSFVPHSYRSAIIGKNDDTTFARSSLAGFTSQSMPPLSSTQPFVPQMLTVRKDQHSSKRGLAFGSMKPPEPLQSHYYPPRGNPSLAGPSSSHNNSNHVADEFPHLDIINDLLDEDKNIGVGASNFPNPDHHQHHLFNNQQFSYNPGDVSRLRFFDRNEQFNDHQRVYGSSHVDLVSYNGQFDGHMVESQWVDLSTMMMMSGNIDGGGPGGYLYQIPDYSRTGDMNRYAYPPAPAGNGH